MYEIDWSDERCVGLMCEFSNDEVNVPWENKNNSAVDMKDPTRTIRQNFTINLN